MGLGAVLLASRLSNKLDKTMYIILKVVAYIIACHRAILLLASIDGYMIVINLCYLVTHILLAVFIGNDMYVNIGKNDKILNDDLHYKG
jgi:hypothetical protein